MVRLLMTVVGPHTDPRVHNHVFKNPYGLGGPCPGGASSLICI